MDNATLKLFVGKDHLALTPATMEKIAQALNATAELTLGWDFSQSQAVLTEISLIPSKSTARLSEILSSQSLSFQRGHLVIFHYYASKVLRESVLNEYVTLCLIFGPDLKAERIEIT